MVTVFIDPGLTAGLQVSSLIPVWFPMPIWDSLLKLYRDFYAVALKVQAGSAASGHALTFPGTEEPDYIKGLFVGMFSIVQGIPGDVLVGLCICAALLSLWRKSYRTSVGFVVLLCGIVVVRVAISILFGGTDFSRM